MQPMKPLEPMKPMKPLEPMESWWPAALGEPSSTGSQNGLRYAFFLDAHRLLIDRGGTVTAYDSGQHRIGSNPLHRESWQRRSCEPAEGRGR
jgi:hypothetical protein